MFEEDTFPAKEEICPICKDKYQWHLVKPSTCNKRACISAFYDKHDIGIPQIEVTVMEKVQDADK